ncbi:hypothetical protein DSAG12_01273 [Promethearchaeum syntrophicum]|uniref:Uncharacterized protein n=1 Tax=Promethearchaeum syntrophicum TaxID=2594042 RepID=A0A5B9D872_9ARCH|nr:hypothetical protein [Candidatus Prometheoarchaeum syntrophicum]QEE15448.1 hypothetical protein DSAG12_01273 [Candidatus Prometheoarchaeum syntrophicum]
MEKYDVRKFILFPILGISFIGFLVVLFSKFAGFWLTGYYTGERYSCLFCEYGTFIDIASIVIILLSILGQIIVVLNEILPKQLIKIDLSLVGLLFAIGTIIFSIVGLVGFGIVYSDYEWWPEAGFYASIITGVFNGLLFAVKFVSKFVKKN